MSGCFFLCGRIAVPFCSAVVLNGGITFSMKFINPFCCNGESVRCIYNKDMFFHCVLAAWNYRPLLFWYNYGTDLRMELLLVFGK
jgi:hypothetical protein